jgi:hypothetical protein
MASGTQTGSNDRSHRKGSTLDARAPAWLRITRGLTGLVLLIAAWGLIVLGLLLAFHILGLAPQRQLVVRLGLYVLGALGMLWLGVVALACLIAGSFCLMLALTTRKW